MAENTIMTRVCNARLRVRGLIAEPPWCFIVCHEKRTFIPIIVAEALDLGFEVGGFEYERLIERAIADLVKRVECDGDPVHIVDAGERVGYRGEEQE